MSLKSFLRRLWAGIKKAFEGLKPELKKAISIGVEVVEKMKQYVARPGVDVLTAIIPGDLDDRIKERLREWLPRILAEMKLVERCMDETDPQKVVECGVLTLQQITGDWISDSARKNFYDSLAVMVAQVASDGKLDWSDAKIILKWYYDNVKKNRPDN